MSFPDTNLTNEITGALQVPSMKYLSTRIENICGKVVVCISAHTLNSDSKVQVYSGSLVDHSKARF